MSAAHTPGPWVIEDGWLQNERGPYVDGLYLSVCMSATRLADGLIIAAAPDMLAALEAEIEAQRLTDEEVEMIEYHAAHGMDDVTGSSHCFSAGKRADEAWAKARELRDAAIAKALGRGPDGQMDAERSL